jgi:hypothetical protein
MQLINQLSQATPAAFSLRSANERSLYKVALCAPAAPLRDWHYWKIFLISRSVIHFSLI